MVVKFTKRLIFRSNTNAVDRKLMTQHIPMLGVQHPISISETGAGEKHTIGGVPQYPYCHSCMLVNKSVKGTVKGTAEGH